MGALKEIPADADRLLKIIEKQTREIQMLEKSHKICKLMNYAFLAVIVAIGLLLVGLI